MNKKIFATALFALAAFVSTGASAANTYSNTVGVAPNAQTDNAVVGKGSTSRANDLRVTVGVTDKDIPADSEIIIRLPAGLNFSGIPTYSVGPAVVDQGLTLKDNTTFGDPTLGTDVGIQMFDTNGDGGNDRALVVAAAAADAGDTLTISINVTADADATAGVKKASIIVAGGLAVSVDLVEVIAQAVTGVVSGTDAELVTVDQGAYVTLDVSTPSFAVVIPAGAKNGDTVTVKPAGKVLWNTTSTVTVTDILTPVTAAPLSQTTTVTGATSTVTYVVKGAPTAGFANDVVVEMQADVAGIAAGSAVGNYGLTVGGTALVSGTANLFAVKPNGSSAALITGGKLTSIVAGSSSPQALASIVITENFEDDALSTATPTIKLTAGAGLKFSLATLSPTVSGLAAPVATLTSSDTVMNITGGARTPGTTTITIGNLAGLATSSASGDLSVTVTGGKTSSPNSTFAIASGVPVGTVTVAGPTGTLPEIGSTSVGTAIFTLNETTYGSITRVSYKSTVTTTGTEITRAFFRVTPTNATINSVAILSPGVAYTAAGTDPTFGPGTGAATGACGIEAAGSASYICEVVTESTSLTAGTDTVSVQIGYTAKGMVGDTVSMTLDGNAGVAGSGNVATIVETTEAKVSGAIKVVKEGLTTAQGVSTFTITQQFAGAIGTGTFRLIAPSGVVFAVPYPAAITGGTATVAADTFAPNDTLLISVGAATSPITVTANVIVASNVSGYIPFDILDGDLDANGKLGIIDDSINLAYADKTLKALDAGSAVSVNAGFSKSDNVVTGGLIGDGYSVKSSNTATVTVSLANVGGSQTLTITGVAAGAANVTVTDELGATDVVAVTVSAGAAIPAAEKGAKGVGDRTGVTFSAGATSDGGSTYGTTFTVDDEVTIIAVIGVDSTDVGSAGATHVAAKLEGNVFVYLDEDGNFADWDTSGLPGANLVTDSLDASYTVTVVDSQKLPAGEHRFALAYSTGGEVIYTGKAIVITITE